MKLCVSKLLQFRVKDMGSGWFIDDIELPQAPQTDERNISRQFQSETLFNFFPNITKSSARAFDYTLTGLAYPEPVVFDLDQIAKSADTNTVVLTIPEDEQIFEFSKFAVKSLVFSRKGPMFIDYDDGSGSRKVKVYPYKLTLTELPNEGEFQEGIDGFTSTNEGAVGLEGLNSLIDSSGSNLSVEDFGPVEAFKLIFGVPTAI